jgi:hypothetical protein
MLAEKGNPRSTQTILWWTRYSRSVSFIIGVVFSNLTLCYASLTASSSIQVRDASHAAPYTALFTVFTQKYGSQVLHDVSSRFYERTEP